MGELEIKPCPLCGEKAVMYKTDDGWECGCKNCKMMSYGEHYDPDDVELNKEEAIRNWNHISGLIRNRYEQFVRAVYGK